MVPGGLLGSPWLPRLRRLQAWGPLRTHHLQLFASDSGWRASGSGWAGLGFWRGVGLGLAWLGSGLGLVLGLGLGPNRAKSNRIQAKSNHNQAK